jgi:CRISPR/Cas system-associated exonuclease Cas4 (RecB family)
MTKTNLKRLKNNDIISASEIGQYYFCSMAWYLQKCGYKPDSPFLEMGAKKHIKLGEIIDETQNKTKKSNTFATIGYLLLICAVLIFIFEVIL